MPIAVVVLDFDPVLDLGVTAVRLETLGTALAILVGLLLAARIAGGTPADGDGRGPHVRRPSLRRDDLLFIVLGIVPGAVVGGRLGYALTHLDFVVADPLVVFDPARGSAELSLAIVGGAVTGGYVAHLLDGPVGRWFHVAPGPLLATIALGKLADVLGGRGQGTPADIPWATAYGGAGPWGSLAPATPSHPAQVYEALAATAVLVVLGALSAAGWFRQRDVRAFLVALGLFALARAVVATFWRDPAVVAGLGATQLLSVAVGAISLGLAVAVALRGRGTDEAAGTEPAWPDPATRPPF